MGPGNLLFGIKRRVLGHRLGMAKAHRGAFLGRGLEIGGPSQIFGAHGAMPVYPVARQIDNVTFASRTRWEGRVEAGETFSFDPRKAAGRQYIAEATDLSAIADESYDFVISSHMLEHCANPIAALKEWRRVVRTDGALLLVVPHRDGTFDRFRPVTPLSHLIQDALSNVREDDRTHLDEILRLHDFSRDPTQSCEIELRTWIENNFENRGAHHHVFDALSLARLIDHLSWQIVDVELMRPHHIFVLARKPASTLRPENLAFLQPQAEYLRTSPFTTDRTQAEGDSP
jgi:SAM-dependent methyltransferase